MTMALTQRQNVVLQHLDFVMKHNGLFPQKGFGGCSCAICNSIRNITEEQELEQELSRQASRLLRENRSEIS